MKAISFILGVLFLACQSPVETIEKQNLEADPLEEKSENSSEAGTTEDELGREVAEKKQIGRRIVPRLLHVANLKIFIQDHMSVHRAYGELERELSFYSGILSGAVPPGESDFNIVKLRVKENPERAHWAFVYGLYDLQNDMLKNKKYLLITDKEKAFVEKMRVLVFLAEEMHALEGNNWYVGSLSRIYQRINEREFRRVVEPIESQASNALDMDE